MHSPFGGQVHAPWALALAARFRERHGLDVQAMHGDDGIVLRLPDVEVSGWGGPDDGLGFLGGVPGFDGDDLGGGPGGDGGAGGPAWPSPEPVAAPDVAELVVLEADDVEDMVTQEIGGSALFASRFRECAARALLLPRRQPGRRQPLWQQRQRAASLLDVARRYPAFPIVLETVRECLQDVFDVPGLVALMREIASGQVRVVEVETSTPSPFARSLLFGYVAQFLYEGDSPLAERRAAALSLDPQLLAELLGRGDGASLRDLLDPDSVRTTERELQRLVDERKARDAEDVADLLRVLGPLTEEEVAARSVEPDRAGEHLARSCSSAAPSRCAWAGGRAPPRSRTPPGCGTRSAPPCPSGCPRRSWSRSRTRSATCWPATPAPTARSPPPTPRPGSASGWRWPSRRCAASSRPAA